MPNNVIISEGSTTNDAIEKGLKILNVSRNMVNIRVLENEDKRSFFSILSPRVVKVELSLKEQKSENDREKVIKEKKPVSIKKIEKAEENVREFLNQFLNKISSEITFKIDKNEYGLDISIDGDASTMLIGYRGETMYAMQNIISSIACNNLDERIRISLDIGNYKAKREETLIQLANKLAKTVEKTRKPITLEPMQAYERKIIHTCLQDSKTVKTESIGEEPKRRIVISLK